MTSNRAGDLTQHEHKCAKLLLWTCSDRHSLSLYTHISSITWDMARPDRAKGAVSDRESHDIRAFDMDEDEVASFDGVNRLWDIIG